MRRGHPRDGDRAGTALLSKPVEPSPYELGADTPAAGLRGDCQGLQGADCPDRENLSGGVAKGRVVAGVLRDLEPAYGNGDETRPDPGPQDDCRGVSGGGAQIAKAVKAVAEFGVEESERLLQLNQRGRVQPGDDRRGLLSHTRSMDNSGAGGPDFDLIAASIRSDAGDLRTFLNVVAAKLEGALPGHVTVERQGSLFAKEHPVRLVRVAFGDRRYELAWVSGGVEARLLTGTSSVQLLPLDRCLELLSEDLVAAARSSTNAKAAMDSLLEGHLAADEIARPAGFETQILYRWPKARTARASVLLVGPDEQAVVVHEGTVEPPLGPGAHRVQEIVGVAAPDVALGDSADLEAQVFLVLTRELSGLKFGGMVDKVADPETTLAVGLRVFGDYALRVVDPVKVATSLGSGTEQVPNSRFTDLVRDLLLKVLREDVVTHIGTQRWPILGLAAHTQEIETETLKAVQTLADGYGLEVTRMGNFTISMKEEDEALLTAHRAKLADLAAGSRQEQTCGSCAAANPAAARFCLECGKPLLVACPNCATSNPSSARFCQSCGTALAVVAGGGANA